MNGMRRGGSPTSSGPSSLSPSTPWSYTHRQTTTLVAGGLHNLNGVASRSPYTPRGRKILFPPVETSEETHPVPSTSDSIASYFDNCKALIEREINRVCCSESYCVNEPLLVRQLEEISFLRGELQRVSSERDALAIQVEQLNMEILAGELGRLESSFSISPSSVLREVREIGEDSGGLGRKISDGGDRGDFGGRRLMGQGQSVNGNVSLISASGLAGFGCLDVHYEDDGSPEDETKVDDDERRCSGGGGGQDSCSNGGGTGTDESEEVEDVIRMSAHLIPQRVDDDVKLASTYSSSEMTRLSSSSSASSASSSPVLFTSSNTASNNGPQSTHQSAPAFHHESNEEHGDTGFVERRYGGVPARDAALVIQRAYRRYSMVKEFQRIKTERRLSRRINNNVISSTTAPPVNSCEICIDVHPDAPHPPIHHHHGGVGHLDGLEDDLEESSMLSGDLPTPQDLAEVTEVDVEVDRTHVPGHSIGLPPPQVHSHHQHHTHHHNHSHHPHHSHQQQQQNSQWHLQKSYSHHHQNSQNNSSRGIRELQHHQSSSGVSGRYPSDSHLSSSRHHYPPNPHQGGQQQRMYIPSGHHHLHHQQSHPQLQHQNTVPPSLSHNQHSAPGGLLMITKGGSGGGHLHPTPNGASPAVSNSSPASSNTTPLTNVSPNLSTSSASSGKVVGGEVDSEVIRKRLYRVGLNLFNKKPEVGITYLVKKKFLEGSAPAVSRFLISRKGLSKQMIGEYLTNLQSPFSMSCLEHFCNEIDLSSMPVDLALRRFQSFYRMPGEAQKIERLMESFSRRYGVCNPAVVSQFRNGADTVFVLAFAIIMLNTDLHTPHLKQDRRMKLDDFVKNLRGVDDGGDIDREILSGIYERIKTTEFKTGSDHVTQVMKVQQTIVGKKPNLAVPHRRLVCYCRLYEVPDANKKEKVGCHQREVFLFNDLLVLTKIFHKKRNSVTYSFRQSYPLTGLTLHLFSNQYYEHGLSLRRGETVLLNLNARNEHDRAKFMEDLREAIAESDEMTRIESLSKENRDRDSGVDVGKIKRFSNSLLDINDQCKPVRRGSCGSLDSGMSVSFQSDETHQNQGPQPLQASNSNSFPLHQHQGSTCSSSSSSSQNSHK